MENTFIMKHVDHALLPAAAGWDAVADLCREAVTYKAASVCIPPSYVRRVCDEFPSLAVCTVIGFPFGYNTRQIKVSELRQADMDGCDEFDMVINIGDVKNGNFKKVQSEITHLKQVSGEKILKVIVETCYLTQNEKIAMCNIVTEAGADYIKTSTGFGTGGATMDDVMLFKNHVGENVKIKASGGIKTRSDMVAYLNVGCARLGTSSAVKILFEDKDGQGY
jgi:deoxyribose-phosphate aldolase